MSPSITPLPEAIDEPRAPSAAHYTALAKFLHWLVAGAIVLQYVLARLAENAGHAGHRVDQLALLANHKSVGMTVFMLAFARVAWRAAHRAPPLPVQMAPWQQRASHASHILLYALIFIVPLSGWLMSSASAYSVSWFNLFAFPDLINGDPDTKKTLITVHEFSAKLMFVVALIHIAAALKHAVIDRDGVLARISSVFTVGVFAVTLVGGVASLARLGSSESVAATANTAPPQRDAPTEQPGAAKRSSLPVWTVDPDASYIEFTGDQAGAAFTGRWSAFDAVLQFDSGDLGAASFDVTIDTTQPNTGDAERDGLMIDPEWFDVANHPTAVYRAADFSSQGDSVVAAGRLTMKGKTIVTPLTFTVIQDGDRRTLDGRAEIDRLAFSLGSGEWADTTWVGQTVGVTVHIEAIVER
ncbi:MAG: YceI family protein [Pseudomonadota bacterium]